MLLSTLLRKLRRDERGNTMLELAFVIIPLSLMMLPGIDLAYSQYKRAVVQGVLAKAARLSTTGQMTNAQVDAVVTDQLKYFAAATNIVITRKSYSNFANVGKPEPITSDTAPIGSYNVGDCYKDMNNNGVWDSDMGKSGQGGADDVVFYTVAVSIPHIVPLGGLIGWTGNDVVTSSTVVRNQPVAAQLIPTPTVRCN